MSSGSYAVDMDSVVPIASDDGRFRGSGFVVSSRWIVTCAHVAHPHWVENRRRWPRELSTPRLRILLPNSAIEIEQIVRCEHSDGPEPDWAALQTSTALDLAPLPLLEGVTDALLSPWSTKLEGAFRSRDGATINAPNLKLVGAWTSEDVLTRGQVESGMPTGASGSPLLVRRDNQVAALGMFYLGGEGVGQSDFYGSDALIRLLRARGIDPLTAPAAQFLALPSEPSAAQVRPLHRTSLAFALLALGTAVGGWGWLTRASTRSRTAPSASVVPTSPGVVSATSLTTAAVALTSTPVSKATSSALSNAPGKPAPPRPPRAPAQPRSTPPPSSPMDPWGVFKDPP